MGDEEPSQPLKNRTVFVGPQDIGGCASRIAEGLAEGGARVLLFRQVIETTQPDIERAEGIDVLFEDGIRKASARLESGGLAGVVGRLALMVFKLRAFLTTMWRADFCIFLGGRGFIGYPIDYMLLRLAGRKILHIYLGTASRPRYMSGLSLEVLASDRPDSGKIRKLARRVRRQAGRVKAINRWATFVMDSSLAGHFHPRPFLDFFRCGMPMGSYFGTPPEAGAPRAGRFASRPRVFHCPSAPEVKGSAAITRAVEELETEGLALDYRMRSGIPHPEVLEEIRQADFVIDQLYSDTPLAGFAAEAVSLGKAPIVGGYGWDLLKASLPAHLVPPAAICHPDRLKETIRELAGSPERAARLAREAGEFLAREWSGPAFSRRIARIADGDIPSDWWIAPEEIRYVHGAGLAEASAREIIRLLVDHCGESALCVDHLPALRAQLLAFARGGEISYTRAS